MLYSDTVKGEKADPDGSWSHEDPSGSHRIPQDLTGSRRIPEDPGDSLGRTRGKGRSSAPGLLRDLRGTWELIGDTQDLGQVLVTLRRVFWHVTRGDSS